MNPEADPYLDGLKLLAGRELSESQVRLRLARRGYAAEEIEAALARLREERAVDDVRVAQAIARTETSVKRRGKLRVRLQIERAGIPAAIARRAVDEVFAEIDHDAMLDVSLERRMAGRERIADEKEFQRLYRYLLNQGFESDRVLAALRKRRDGR